MSEITLAYCKYPEAYIYDPSDKKKKKKHLFWGHKPSHGWAQNTLQPEAGGEKGGPRVGHLPARTRRGRPCSS